MRHEFPGTAPDLVIASGGPREIGQTIGTDTGDLISESLDLYRRRFAEEARLDESGIRAWGQKYGDVVAQYNPRLYETIQGIAETSGQRADVLFALNARTEILYGSKEQDDACTTAALMPQRTESGHTILAQNWDWRANLKRFSFVLATEDEAGHRVITLVEAGMLAKSGLNSQGIGVCANLLVSDRDKCGDGTPYHFLLRGILESRNMSQANFAALDTKRASSGNLLLGADGGEAVDLEVVPDSFGYLLPQDGILTHSNHFLTDLDVHDMFAQRSALTLLRHDRLRRLLSTAGEKVSLQQLSECLADHFSYPDGICRHVDTEKPRADQVSTVYSILMELETRDFYISAENCCENSYWKWNLDEIFEAKRVIPTEHFEKTGSSPKSHQWSTPPTDESRLGV